MERLLKTLGKILAALFLAIFAVVASILGVIGYGIGRGWEGLRKSRRSTP